MMIFLALLLMMVCISSSINQFQSSLSLYLHEPRNHQVYTLDSIHTTSLNIEIRFQIFGNYDNNNSIDVCFEVLTTTVTLREHSNYINMTCLKYDEASRISIEKLVPNSYTINLYIKNDNDGILDHTRITSNFLVNRFVESLPKITLSSELVYILEKDIQIEYTLSTSYLPTNNLNICLRLMTEDGIYLMEYYCMSTNYSSFSLKNIENVGKYNVVLILANQFSSEYYEDSKIIVPFVIKFLEELIPNIKLNNKKIEAVVNENILLPFEIEPNFKNVIERLELCVAIRLIGDSKPKYIINDCSTKFKSPLTISNLNEGTYMVTLSFRNLKSISIYYEPVASVEAIVYKPSEFMPSYDWEPIKIYETVPNGLEIMLPLGSVGTGKMARIPQPWQLQLPLPYPCKYFVRMNIFKQTHIHEIITAAEKTCKLDKDCLYLMNDDKVIDPGQDALSSNLFNINKLLKINESCQKQHGQVS